MRSKSSQNAVNIINFITFLVIVIGSAALFIVLSGFSGLKTFSLSFSSIFDPDLKATPISGKFFSLSLEQEQKLQEIEGIAFYSKEMEEQVYLTYNQKSSVAYLKGVDSAYIQATMVDSAIYWGNWAIDNQQAVVGLGIAHLLSLSINDYQNPLQILAPKPGLGSQAQQGFGTKPYNEMPVVISGVYAVEENLDKKYILTSLPLAQVLLEKDNTQISGINFRLDPEADVKKVRQDLSALLGENISLLNRRQLNSSLYRMLNTENLATYLIFTLVLIIALFNVVGAIIMMILDKQQNSKTLYCLGVTIKEIRRVYFVQGVIVTSMGGVIGLFLASLLIWSQLAFGWLRITPTLAYPVEYKLVNVLVVLATIVVLGILASKIASSRVTKKLLS